MPAKKIIMIVGDFVEDYEAMVSFQMLVMVGHVVDSVCPGKKAGETVKTAIHDFEGDQTYTEKPGHNFVLTRDFEEVNPEDYDGLVIPGGRSPEYLRLNEDMPLYRTSLCENSKPIASICHGQQILAAAGILEGKLCTAYPVLRPDLIKAGAKWQEPNQDFSDACVDGNLVTASAWPADPEWIRKFLDLLGTKIEP